LAWIQDEPTAAVVDRLLSESRSRVHLASWSLINAGEVYYQLRRRRGEGPAEEFWHDVLSGVFPVQLLGVTQARVRAAARLKAAFRVSYADAFAMALAQELGQPLVTGDAEIRQAAAGAGVELQWLGRRER